ncbi:MAG: SpoIIIAH-like family protein [Clostridia bacterium]|nr:SpoIIIAH-like family protein [Clostridia bacterium]
MALVSTKEQTGALYAADYDESDELAENTESTESTENKKNSVLDWISRVGKRNWAVVGAVALIGVAAALNWMFFSSGADQDSYPSYDQSAGMIGQEDATDVGKQEENAEDYFTTAELNRRQARDESLEVLQNVIDSDLADEAVKAQAMEEMAAIASEIDAEANIESLLMSKGFADCIAILNGESINVVVKSEGELQPSQIAQINAVVFEQTGLEPINVVINHRQ